MAIVSYGYDSTVSEGPWARLAPWISRGRGVSGLTAAAVAGATPIARISTGEAYDHGVLAVSDATVDVPLDPVGSGSRWDTIVVYRDWMTNTSSIVRRTGGSAQAVSGQMFTSPGSRDDQPLWLAQVTVGQAAPTALIDLRPRRSGTLTLQVSVGTDADTPSVPSGWVRHNLGAGTKVIPVVVGNGLFEPHLADVEDDRFRVGVRRVAGVQTSVGPLLIDWVAVDAD